MNRLLCIVFGSILVNLLVNFGSDAAHLTIRPAKCIAILEDSVQMSCAPDTGNGETKDVTFMELSRNDEDPIAYLRDCSNITYGKGREGKFKAEGRIERAPMNSYLNVTLMNPSSQDTGIYTCLVLYVDADGHPQQETSTTDLVVEKLDVKSLESALISLKDSVSTIKKDQGKCMDDLQDQVNYMVAFSAAATQKSNGDYIRPSKGDVLVFSDVIMRVGEGYDETTGRFTAPRNAIYAFHLQINDGSKCSPDIQLMVNDAVIALAFNYANNNWNPASTHTVTELKAGDVVFAVFKTSGCTGAIRHRRYSTFSGYLLKAF